MKLQLLTLLGALLSANAELSTQFGYAPDSLMYSEYGQAYFFNGFFISCSNQRTDNKPANDFGCSRWAVYSAFIDVNSEGYGFGEYYPTQEDRDFSDTSSSYAFSGSNSSQKFLDCNYPSSNTWTFVGAYYQEAYQFLEQNTKHYWGDGTFGYNTMLDTLEYVTEYDCQNLGTSTNDGATVVYGGLQPLEGGLAMMSIYEDKYCLTTTEDHGTYDDYYNGRRKRRRRAADNAKESAEDPNEKSRRQLGSWGYEYTRDTYSNWYENAYDNPNADQTYGTMSYNLTDTLLILKEKMRCNRCLIDGAYQDGEECDAINMCWKYWSHDAWRMDGGMMVKADGQNTLNINLQKQHKRAELVHFQSSNTSNYNMIQQVIDDLEDPQSHANKMLLQSFLTMCACSFVFVISVVLPNRRKKKRKKKHERARMRKKNGRDKLLKFKNPFQGAHGKMSKKSRKSPKGVDRSNLLSYKKSHPDRHLDSASNSFV
ncbi:hypothetical protein TrVE_jg14107 [Triparma verrucosa]|uniref:Uncharacterized protein n=1 Tax=Triparma verrucosa TaxID=1606542 RepID=A0A9W7BLG9_9STRA|nr:hypothetical protein TrVE_jg14107 [Triparma verrucosa]